MIAVFDSGVGGLGIYQAIRKRLPHKDYIYIADSKNFPYGTRSEQEIRNSLRSITRYLLEQGVELMVIACNTATVSGISYLRSWFPIPFIGVVPAIKPAAESTKKNKIAVIGTELTVRSEYNRRLIEKFADAKEVISIAAPELVNIIESATASSEEIRNIIAPRIEELKKHDVDQIVLGCTHYTLAKNIFEDLAGPDIQIIDSNEAVARQVEKIIHENALNQGSNETVQKFVTTGNKENFERAIHKYLDPYATVETV